MLRVEGVSKSFQALKALDSVTLEVADKSRTILVGPNGSGKTTLINVIAGFHKPDSGKVFYDSVEITNWSPHCVYRFGIARTFQQASLFTRLTVLDNLLVAGKGNPGERVSRAPFKRFWTRAESEAVEKASNVLEMIGLSGQVDRVAGELSGGQMKLLEIGRAIMSDSKLILMDEPIAGVNPTLAREIFSSLTKLRDRLGLTFLIIEHRLDIALQYSDWMHVMANGRVIASGLPKEVVSNPTVIEAYLGG